jgi:nitrate reductase delta subunit
MTSATTATAAFEALGALFAYPRSDYMRRLEECRRALAETGTTEAQAHLDAFASSVGVMEVERLQELFTGTFDLNPKCTLDIGWHLFGEQYERGAFLVEIRDALREVDVAESVELPDHLTHVLALVGRLDAGRATDLTTRAVAPALEKILSALGDGDSPFKHLVHAAAALVAYPRSSS